MVGGMALKGNPYDGHSMRKALQQVRRLSGQCIEEVFVDRGYPGHDESESEVYVLGKRRGVKTRRLKRCMKRRQVIESVISHLNNDGWLGRNHLKGEVGNQMNVLLSCAGHDLRLVLKSLEIFLSPNLGALGTVFGGHFPLQTSKCTNQFRYRIAKG